MACKTESKQIGDFEFSATQWPADKAMLMKFRIAKALSASIEDVVSKLNFNSKKGATEKDIGAVVAGLSRVFRDNDPEELSKLLKDSILGCACNGERITPTSFTEIFSGDNLSLVYKVFFFVVKVNYSNFIPARLEEKMAGLSEKL